MQSLFLGYGGTDTAAPAWMNSSLNKQQKKGGNTSIVLKVTDDMLRQMEQTVAAAAAAVAKPTVTIAEYIEVWDYVGGASFRGFITENPLDKERSLFLFFEQGVEEAELKPGLVALLDLAIEGFDCQNLTICIDRQLEGLDSLVHNLGWVGLEAITLKHWGHASASKVDLDKYVSDKWLFLGMEL